MQVCHRMGRTAVLAVAFLALPMFTTKVGTIIVIDNDVTISGRATSPAAPK